MSITLSNDMIAKSPLLLDMKQLSLDSSSGQVTSISVAMQQAIPSQVYHQRGGGAPLSHSQATAREGHSFQAERKGILCTQPDCKLEYMFRLCPRFLHINSLINELLDMKACVYTHGRWLSVVPAEHRGMARGECCLLPGVAIGLQTVLAGTLSRGVGPLFVVITPHFV